MKIVDENNQGQLGAGPAVGLLHCPQSSLQQLDVSPSLCQDRCKQLEGHPSPFLSLPTQQPALNSLNVGERAKINLHCFQADMQMSELGIF